MLKILEMYTVVILTAVSNLAPPFQVAYYPSMSASRSISPALQKFRDFMLGRALVNPVRFPQEVSARSGQEANLPEGPAHKGAENYYFTRDARREVARPRMLADNTRSKALASGQEVEGSNKVERKWRTPGAVYPYSQ